MELDPQEGEWHFLFGKSLGRIRRVDNYTEVPAQEELIALEKAVRLTRNPSFIIFLAQAYREVSFRVYSLHRSDLSLFEKKLDGMNRRSSELYRQVHVLHYYKTIICTTASGQCVYMQVCYI
jgi:hypothetical protein